MLSKQKKNSDRFVLQVPLYFGVFFVFALSSVSALSISGILTNFLDLVQAEGSTKKEIKEENVQNLKVFEANRNVKNISFEETLPNAVFDNDNLTLDADVNNFSNEEDLLLDNHNHSDNALYKVQKGESIYSIASYFGVSVETIMSFNKMKDKEVHAGDILEIPSTPGILYTIKKGDTISNLAKKYTIDQDDITLYNGLLENEDLAVGDELFLPGAKEKEAPKKEISKTKKSTTSKIPSNIANYIPKTWARGDTSHLNTPNDVRKYSSLPKYAGYYIYPAPGTTRTQKLHGHNGSDFAGKIGTPVLASATGVVRVAKSGGYNFGYGNYIIVTHGNGSETVYAHLSSVNVSVGQTVSSGEVIGRLGSSGNSTGPHLHFEIRGAYNPWAW